LKALANEPPEPASETPVRNATQPKRREAERLMNDATQVMTRKELIQCAVCLIAELVSLPGRPASHSDRAEVSAPDRSGFPRVERPERSFECAHALTLTMAFSSCIGDA
jgi:hypothetical protein